MDSDDSWKTYDDSKMKSRDLFRIIDSTQAYILFYELI
jgi:ubiquitin C-terminal hydrolase